MTWLPGRGRPVVIPEDITPLRGARVDARVRVAWLLRLNRLAYAPGPAGRFVDRLRAHGCALGPSTLCRYETGVEAVPKSAVRAYERALDLPTGQLLGACFGLDRVFGPTLSPESPRRVSRAALTEALGQWETRVAAGAMTGADWIHVADALTRPSGPVLPLSMLHGWMDQLVLEAMRSVRHAYTTRVHALGVLMTDRAAGRIVLDAVARVTAQPGAQNVTNVIPVLGSSPDPAVLQWLIEHFERSEGEQMWGAAYGLLIQICNGRMPADLVPRVARAALAAAGEGEGRGEPAFAVAQRLSAKLTQQVVGRLGYYAAPTMPGARVQSPTALSTYRSAALRESGLDDPLLDRLLREALSPDFVERRHHSSLLLAASPYRSVVSEVATQQVADPSGPYAEEAAAHLLGYLAIPEQRDRLTALLTTAPASRAGLLRALAHTGGVPERVDLVALAADPRLAPTVVYAAGMSKHPDLARMAADSRLAGMPAQRSAAWWQATGGAIAESPAVLSRDCLTLAG